MTLAAGPGIGAGVIHLPALRALAMRKGLNIERHQWRGRVRLVCSNAAVLRHYPDGYSSGLSAFGHNHAWRFLQSLPDLE